LITSSYLLLFNVNHGDDGFTEDWAVVEVYSSLICEANFVGNAIDLGFVDVDKLTTWMYHNLFQVPQRSSPSLVLEPSLTRICSSPTRRPKDHDNDPVIKVLKNGSNTTGLTVGRLNTIRAFTRQYFKGPPHTLSKEGIRSAPQLKVRPHFRPVETLGRWL
jgi:hypothetical protein